jgi:hypothetical protein
MHHLTEMLDYEQARLPEVHPATPVDLGPESSWMASTASVVVDPKGIHGEG